MHDSVLQPERAATHTSPPVASADFWATFHMFASRFDESGFTYWYLYTPGYFILLFIPYLLQTTRIMTLFTPREMDFYSGSSWLMLLIALAIVLLALSFNLWRSSIRETFENLLKKQRICLRDGTGALDQEYRSYLDGYQADLLSTRRYIAIVPSMIASLALFWVLLMPYAPSSSPFSLLLLFVAPGALILGYFVGISSWIMIMSGIRLRALTQKFMLNIEPAHPDNCGGLRFLGNFCLGMAIPILLGITFFALYGIGGPIFPKLIHDQHIARVVAGIGLFVFDIPLAILSFFFPLWYIHGEMLLCKEAYEDNFGNYITQLEQKLWTALNQKNLEEAKTIKEQIEIAQVINPAAIGYPSWPFDRRILFIYLLPQVFPFLSLLLPVLLPLFIHP